MRTHEAQIDVDDDGVMVTGYIKEIGMTRGWEAGELAQGRGGGRGRGIVALIVRIIGFLARRPILTACFSSFFRLFIRMNKKKKKILSACSFFFLIKMNA